MKKLLLSGFMFTTFAMAQGPCASTVNFASLADSAALFCKGSCNVMEVLGPAFKKEGKRDSFTTKTTLLSETSYEQVYKVETSFTDSQRQKHLVSEYIVTTDEKCMLQEMRRTKH